MAAASGSSATSPLFLGSTASLSAVSARRNSQAPETDARRSARPAPVQAREFCRLNKPTSDQLNPTPSANTD